MTITYFLSKFSGEALLVELFFIVCLSLVLVGYYFTKRWRHGVAREQIPDQVVRAFLSELQSTLDSFKTQLYGSQHKRPPATDAPVVMEQKVDAKKPVSVAKDGKSDADLLNEFEKMLNG